MPTTSLENEAYPAATGGTAPVVGGAAVDWSSYVGTIIVFLAILFIAWLVIRRLKNSATSGGSTFSGSSTSWARVIDRQVLNGQQVLYLVEVAGQLQVLAGAEHYMMKIADIDDPRVAAEILTDIATRSSSKTEGLLAGAGRKIFGPKAAKSKFSSELERLLEEVDK